MSTLLDPQTRVSTIFGAWKGKFQIPNTPGNFPGFAVDGVGPFSPQNNSATLNENQYESNVVGVMAWQRSRISFETAPASACSRRNLARVVVTSWACRRSSKRKGDQYVPTANIGSCDVEGLQPHAACRPSVRGACSCGAGRLRPGSAASGPTNRQYGSPVRAQPRAGGPAPANHRREQVLRF
jgi:hypothetical protein